VLHLGVGFRLARTARAAKPNENWTSPKHA
jgi:hypothetical protein